MCERPTGTYLLLPVLHAVASPSAKPLGATIIYIVCTRQSIVSERVVETVEVASIGFAIIGGVCEALFHALIVATTAASRACPAPLPSVLLFALCLFAYKSGNVSFNSIGHRQLNYDGLPNVQMHAFIW